MAAEKITMQELASRTKALQPGEVVLDVRSPEEFQSAHVPGAINIPHDQVGAQIEKIRAYKRVYIHCQAGGRAGVAAGVLTQAGLTNIVCVAGGGMGDWLAAGLPVAKGR